MKLALFLVLALACLLPTTLHLGATNDELVAITDAEQVVAVTTHDWGLGSDGKAKLIVAVWADGSVIWSENRTDGGAPYLTGKIEPESCPKLLKRLELDGYFSNESLRHARFGPDARFTSILIKNKNQELKMASWHELYNVCTSAGITSFKGTRLESLGDDKKEYLHYRLAWAELRLMINHLIPLNGQSTNGDIHMEHGIISWAPHSE